MMKKLRITLVVTLSEDKALCAEGWIDCSVTQQLNESESLDLIDIEELSEIKHASPELQAGKRLLDDFNRVTESIFGGRI